MALGIVDDIKVHCNAPGAGRLSRFAAGDACRHDQSKWRGLQYHAHGQPAVFGEGSRVVKIDAALAQTDLPGGAKVRCQLLRHRTAEQVDAFIDDLQVLRQRAVALADLAQKVLRLIIEHVHIGQQVEQGALLSIEFYLWTVDGTALKKHLILNAKELTAVFMVCVHGDSRWALMTGADQPPSFSVTCRAQFTGWGRIQGSLLFMFRPLPFFIGLRYTRAKRRNHFISFISLISMLGLTLGVMVMILVLSVMNGFDRELRTRILGMVPHATINGYQPIDDWRSLAEQLESNPKVVGTAPFIQLQGMLTHNGSVAPVLVNGIDPQAEKRVSILQNHMQSGSLDNLAEGEFGIVIGELIAKRFDVAPGDKLTFVLPEASVTPAGVFPRLKRFTVAGVFKVGAELDGSLAMIHVADAARLSRWQPGQVQGVRLQLQNLFEAPQVAWDLVRELPGDYYAQDWTRTHGNLFAAIKMEKTMIGLLLMLIVAVAAFNIISTLVMVVTDKKADIAILRTLGATPGSIMGIFMVQGSLIGVVGTVSGCILGVLAALNVSDMVAWLERVLGIQFLSSDVYFISYLPSELIWSDVVVICTTALSLSFLATLYPAWRASRTEPAEALRYD